MCDSFTIQWEHIQSRLRNVLDKIVLFISLSNLLHTARTHKHTPQFVPNQNQATHTFCTPPRNHKWKEGLRPYKSGPFPSVFFFFGFFDHTFILKLKLEGCDDLLIIGLIKLNCRNGNKLEGTDLKEWKPH